MSVDGTWNLTISTPMGKRDAALTVAADGAALTGTADVLGNATPLEEGAVDGNSMSFVIPVKRPMPMRLKFDVVVDGDALTGKVKAGAMGEQNVVGTRG